MELVRGDIVRSVAGHDRGSLLLVTDVRGDRICVVDGRLRKLENPKQKNRKHLHLAARPDPDMGVPETDSGVRALLARYA